MFTCRVYSTDSSPTPDARVTCKRWATLSKPLLADGVLLMLAQVLTNAKQRARQLAYAHKRTQHITAAADSAPDVNEAVVSARAVRAARRGAATSSTPDGRTECLAPLPEVGEGELAAASAALALLRPMPEYGHDLSCEAIDKFNELRPKFDDEEAAILVKVEAGGSWGLTGWEWDALVDPLGRERSSVATYMMGGSLRVGDSGETARERACRASGGRIETPLGDLTLQGDILNSGRPRPRTQLCCFDGAGRKFSWTTERPHLKATPLEQRMICLAELAWGNWGDMNDAQPFTRCVKGPRVRCALLQSAFCSRRLLPHTTRGASRGNPAPGRILLPGAHATQLLRQPGDAGWRVLWQHDNDAQRVPMRRRATRMDGVVLERDRLNGRDLTSSAVAR